MSRYVVELPEQAPEMFGVDAAHVGSELLLAAAAKLYELRRLSTGAAAEFAGISMLEFQDRMAEFGVYAFDQTPEELETELQNTRLG